MEEQESRACAETVVKAFSGKSPERMHLISSGYGPTGWSKNRIWRADVTADDYSSLVIKMGDGPMAADTVVMEIDLFEKVLPRSHVNLPIVYKTSREPTPSILMEHLSPVPLLANLADTPPTLLHELAVILPSILLASTPEKSRIKLHNAVKEHPASWPLSYGNLNLRNLGRRPDGTLVLFDWDGARRAPLGLDFKLFREHACFADLLRLFHRQCRDLGVSLPPIDTWSRTLRHIWDEQDKENGLRQSPAGDVATRAAHEK